MFVLPVEAGLTSLSSQYSDGLEELRLLNVPNRFNVTLVAPSFNYEPWYGDNVNDPTHRMESFIVKDLVPWTNTIEAASSNHERWLIGFSKSGNGVMDLILRNPNVFSAAACWDAPVEFTDMSAFPDMVLNFGTEANFNNYEIPTLVQNNGAPFKTVNRLWLSGDQGQWTTQMQQLDTQMTSAGVLHTYIAGPARAHSWNSGWLDGAVTSLSGKTFILSPSDLNSQRIIAYGLRSPNRFTFRPGTSEIWTGDVGWNDWEEIDRVSNATDSVVRNFGWPAYEGSARQSIYDAANLPLIENLYADPTATSSPFYTYSHAAGVVAGSGEPTGASSISGLSFYSSGSYPQAFNGSLFFADSSRGRIYVMYRAPNGDPDPTNRAVVSTALNPVDLQTGPGGDLFYVDMSSGSVHRLSWVPGNRAPVAVVQANPTTGPAPLTVNFSAASSSDPDAGDTISFAWDLDNDGQFNDSTSVAPQFTFTSGGNKTVRLQVTDNHGASTIATTVINVNSGPPTAFIDTLDQLRRPRHRRRRRHAGCVSGLVAIHSASGFQHADVADVQQRAGRFVHRARSGVSRISGTENDRDRFRRAAGIDKHSAQPADGESELRNDSIRIAAIGERRHRRGAVYAHGDCGLCQRRHRDLAADGWQHHIFFFELVGRWYCGPQYHRAICRRSVHRDLHHWPVAGGSLQLRRSQWRDGAGRLDQCQQRHDHRRNPHGLRQIRRCAVVQRHEQSGHRPGCQFA
jgi:PKD repeat protein